MNRAMKDSGIPWIGEIPEGWEVCRLKDCGYLYGGLTGKSGDDFNVEDNDNYALFIPFTNIYNNLYINPNDLRKVKIEADEQQNLVKSGDLLFLMSSEDYEGIGKSSLLKENIETLYLNSFCKGFHITDKKVNPVYLIFLLTSEILRELIRVEAKGFIRINLRQDRLSCVPIILPPLAEQEAIAAFLDRKCGEVDAMVSLQEQVIEELKAYKQSVITEAVTKGLNPNAPMKPSHIDWIGEIPEHWEIKRIKHISHVVRGGSPRPAGDARYYQGNIPFMKVADITKDEKKFVDSCEYTIKEAGLTHTRMVPSGTLLLTNSGATLGVPKINTFNTTFNDGIAAFLDIDKNIDIIFAYYSLKARTRLFLESASLGIGQPNLNTDIIGGTSLLIPPLSEQREIADYLDGKCAEIDALISLKQQKIEELREYKKSLIYEYVTGKKQVSS